ncbi:MAG: peroxiredoxin [bacterium]
MKRIITVLLALLAMNANAQEVGKPAPSFEAPSTEGKTVKLSDYKGSWLVLYFYPKSFTTGCTKEACSFRDGFSELKDLGAVILGVSFDDLETQNKFRATYNLPFHLLSDRKKKVARAYDALGIAGLMAQRRTFLIDPNGNLAHIFSNVDVGKHNSEVAAVLKKLKNP